MGATGAAYFGLDFSVGYAFNNIVDDTTPPVVTASQSFSYAENQAANAQVGTVSATDAIGVTKFRFSSSGTTTSADGYYTIDNTGVIRMTSAGAATGVAQNDYDISPNNFTYDVQAGDAADNWSSSVAVTLNVTAAAPKITGPSGGAGAAASAISVNENQTAVTTLTADRAVTWSISGGVDASKFAINAATGVVTFISAPDYEAPTDTDTNNAYVLVVTATDGGGLTTPQTITVTVLDVADNAPVITGPGGVAGATSSAISVNENQTAVTTLAADRTVSWSISGGADASKLAIDSATGVVAFIAAPDFEAPTDADTNNAYVLVVTATDGGGLTTTQTITVTVLDVADNPPLITGPGGVAGATSSAISVNENQTAVTTLAADRTVAWTISGGADAAKFTINSTTGVITFVAAPDYEAPTDADTNNVYLIQVTATDANNETAMQSVSVTVLNVVESSPALTGPSGGPGAAASAISVNENQTAVTTLAADRTVAWTISGGADASKFAIDSTTGVVTFIAAPDYEAPTDADANNVYLIEVTATDANNETAVQTLSVTVLNVVEPSPVLTGPSGGPGAAASAISVNENQTAVTTLAADRTVAWTISGGADASKLAIDSATGVVTFIAAPDYEAPTDADANNVYLIQVTATDANNETAVQTLSVTVLDVIDTSPIVTMPGGEAVGDNVAITMLEDQVEITTFASSRPVIWKISGGVDRARFQIGATGSLAFISAPDYAAPTDADSDNIYIVEVTASDGMGLTSVHTLMVTIENNDHAAPLIRGPGGVAGAESSVMDLTEGVTPVTTFGANETVTWSLAGGADQALFVIDGSTGELRFVKPKSFETPEDSDKNNAYVVVVRATDAVGNSSEHRLTVQITDVDEVAPRIAAIANELRSDLRTYAFNSLGDMLAFNEGLFRDTGDCMASEGQGAIRPGMQLNEFNQGASLDWDRTHCTARYRVIANAGAAIDHADGDWTRRGLASVRVETELKQDVTLGVGLMGSFANNDLPSFADSSISDHTLQINGYLKAHLAENLRAGAFVGLGRAWYDFDLHQPGFDLSGKMVGHRQVYGAMLSGDIEVGEVLVTTDVILSRATEDLGQADLTGTVGDETRKVLFDIGDVDMTRLSIPVSGEFHLWGEDPQGWKSTLRLSPGLLCEDTSADTSSLTCGYQFGGRLIAKREGSGGGYFDYRLESVDRRTRNMIGIGYEYIFGSRRNLELGFDVTGSVVDNRSDSRAMITFRAR